jgi:hypothetical protein
VTPPAKIGFNQNLAYFSADSTWTGIGFFCLSAEKEESVAMMSKNLWQSFIEFGTTRRC